MPLIKHLKAILLLPFMVIVVVPQLILFIFEPNSFALDYRTLTYFYFQSVGVLLSMLGLTTMALTIRDMHRIGKGTLAPWDKKQQLVVVGLYRHVRNPMLIGVLLILAGQACFFMSYEVLYWFLFFAVINGFYIALVEEKALEKQFGEQYTRYKKNVPPWLPLVTAWKEPEDSVDGDNIEQQS